MHTSYRKGFYPKIVRLLDVQEHKWKIRCKMLLEGKNVEELSRQVDYGSECDVNPQWKRKCQKQYICYTIISLLAEMEYHQK